MSDCGGDGRVADWTTPASPSASRSHRRPARRRQHSRARRSRVRLVRGLEGTAAGAADRSERHLIRQGRPGIRARSARPASGSSVARTAPRHDASVAVSSPDGRYVAYHSWQGKTPLLRVHDLRDGSDRLLARGAQTVAWGADGRIAYFQADHARYAAGPYLGKIVVRSLTRPSTAWTPRAGGYEAVAWAGGRLLIGVRPCVFLSARTSRSRGSTSSLGADGCRGYL